MKPSKVLEQHRDVIRRIIAKGPLRNPRVFGSVVRGEDRIRERVLREAKPV